MASTAIIARLGPQFRQIGGGPGAAAGAAADHRSRHRRRLHLRAGRSARRRSAGARAGRARAHRRGQPGPAAVPRLQHVLGDQSRRSISISIATRRRSSGVPLNSVFQALQASLGGYFVNNVNLFGRTWQVQVQAEAQDRAGIDDIYRINVRSDDGKMIPLRSLVEAAGRRRSAGADPLQQPEGRDDSGRPGAGRLHRSGAAGDGGGRGAHAAAGLCRRMDRHRLPGKARGRQDRDNPRLRHAVRLSVPGRALRKLDDTGAGSAIGDDRHRRLGRGDRARAV